ncbi:RNA methyltransferase [Microbacterium esteraromaticum]|uniref:RNA methyltransferase n=1 Tax=Microbacterium esteraromaticum TaxID=57043 RepID=A0A7D8AI17_9MICO|nr:RNA methyltransferase [Microbacterium esteraromaticum]QMU98123.1 RNA methyltransferase [Microbacterium esteraromaticum]
MQLHHLADPHDPVLDDYRALTDTALRRVREPAGGLYIAESAKVIERALHAGHLPRSVLTQQKWTDAVADLLGEFDVPVYVVADDVAAKLTGFAVHRGVMAAMHRPTPTPVDELLSAITSERPRVAILEGLTDHTNVGAIFRSAAALGVDAVLVTPTCADPLYRRAVRVSMGTVFQVPWTRIDPWPRGIDDLRAAGYVVAGMTLGEGAISLDELVEESTERLALVFGTEGDGILPDTDTLLDRRVTIPMRGGVDSLNVAAASAVAFYATR